MNKPHPNKELTAFLKTVHCLVVEPSQAFINSIVNSFVNFGMPASQIHSARRLEDAMELLEVHKPSLLVTEYFLGDKFGLALVDKLDSIVGEKNRIAIMITKNATDSAVAEAAEEQIDAYILKPFSMGDFQKKVEDTIMAKIKPTQYVQYIRAGKALLEQNEFDKAAVQFLEAKKIGQKPSLAFYYNGVVSLKKQEENKAVEEFENGLEIIPLHYRCLMGEFDLLFHQKKYEEAYKLIPDIKANYPLSPHRLGQCFITAVYSNNFLDIPEFFKVYTNLNYRPIELSKIATLALRTAGKFALKESRLETAYSCFEMGTTTSNLDPEFLDYAIKELCRHGGADKAQEIYKKFPNQLVGSEKHQILGFIIDRYILKPEQALEKGKKILNQINGDPEFYKEMVRLAVQLDKRMIGETVIAKAIAIFPDLRKELYDILG